ncbi:MAG: thymidine phosphorylase [Candidatus Gastranaerophilales bacterium]|nr:thymidine phosphorylase [Candidatus Gastranaerophilales bacterium]
MRTVDLITKKKQGKAHTRQELEYIVNGIVSGEIPDYQLSAWLMAVYFQGMDIEETAILTELIVNTSKTLDLSHISNYILDKHSTGGVGDKITLILIPLIAACGGEIAKLSGRGLGHTGGTIDKLESIEGFKTDLSMEEFTAQVKKTGCAIASQTGELAYADKKLYELRDVTSTVDCLPLIASSVVSKKIASGANVIVLDVKYGDGAFLKTKEEAEKLSVIMVDIAKKLNRSITAVITSMEEPLGHNIGNALEVIESIEVLKGKGPADLVELTLELGSILLVNSKVFQTKEEAKAKMLESIANGSALAKFKELIQEQHGCSECTEDYSKLPRASIIKEIKAKKEGFINTIKAYEIALGCKILGAGRDKKTDAIDYAVGVVLNKKVGEFVKEGEILFTIHANAMEKLIQAEELFEQAFVISDVQTAKEPLIYKVIE